MNLPACAPEFLSAFQGMYTAEEYPAAKTITAYVYCFAKGEDPTEIATNLIKSQFDFDVSSKIKSVKKVRTVSNNKEMMRVILQLDADILVKRGVKRKADDESCSSQSVYRNLGVGRFWCWFFFVAVSNGEKPKEDEQRVQGGRSQEPEVKKEGQSGHQSA